MTQTEFATRRERREQERQAKNTVSTWHNGRFGVWQWSQLTPFEQQQHLAAQKRNQYNQLFGIYA